ncbi:MAG TPA: hypothetical protein DCK85_04120 [Ktedonobacter sp.]|jgi:hypothetical protein|nr:hypothetical protein [Ktedonobacter sp.]
MNIKAVRGKVGHLPGYVEKGTGMDLTSMKGGMDTVHLDLDLTSLECAGGAVLFPLVPVVNLVLAVKGLVSLDEGM